MSSILNSISSGDLRVQDVPGDTSKNDSIPIDTYKSTLVIWAGEAGSKQDIRIGYERGTSTIEYDSYTNTTTKNYEYSTTQTPNGLAYLLEDFTGVVYDVK